MQNHNHDCTHTTLPFTEIAYYAYNVSYLENRLCKSLWWYIISLSLLNIGKIQLKISNRRR